MRCRVWLCLPLGLFALLLRAEEGPPKILSEAAHCLVKDDWLAPADSKKGNLTLGYLTDTKTYPGEKVLFVVAFTGRRKGRIFELTATEHGGQDSLRVENNGKFKESPSEINFVEELLGGVWTHAYLESAIRQIDSSPRFVISIKELRDGYRDVQCSSYLDK